MSWTLQMMDFARTLRPRWRTAILSNSGDGARREEERRYRFSEYFDPIVYSHEIGLAKPDPRAYAAACDQMGVSAADVLFIDDLEVNVDGARRIGMTTILHASSDATIAAASQVLGLHVSAISWPSLRAWRHSLQVRPPADRQAELDER